MLIWMDGRLRPREEAVVSVFDHGLLYGDGVFEGIRVYGRRAFRLDQHLDRLWASGRALALDIPLTRADMVAAIRDTVRANGRDDAYVRLVVTRGVGDLGVDPRRCARPGVFIIATDIAVFPAERYAHGIRAITSATRQVGADAFDPRIKSLNYLKNVLAKLDANAAGVEEAIMLNAHGWVAECSADNVFVVRGGTLATPPPQDGALEGITRGAVLDLAAEAGVPASEARLGRYDLYTADEVFVTGTGAEVMPVVEIDGRRIADGKPGPLARRLSEAFHALVRVDGSPMW